MLGRPAGPGGEGGGGVGTPRVVSADPGLLGTFWQTRELHSRGVLGWLQGRGLTSVWPCSLSCISLWSGAWPELGPKKGRGSVGCLAPAGLVQSHGHSAFPQLWSS